jgi:hypothetical protein
MAVNSIANVEEEIARQALALVAPMGLAEINVLGQIAAPDHRSEMLEWVLRTMLADVRVPAAFPFAPGMVEDKWAMATFSSR